MAELSLQSYCYGPDSRRLVPARSSYGCHISMTRCMDPKRPIFACRRSRRRERKRTLRVVIANTPRPLLEVRLACILWARFPPRQPSHDAGCDSTPHGELITATCCIFQRVCDTLQTRGGIKSVSELLIGSVVKGKYLVDRTSKRALI